MPTLYILIGVPGSGKSTWLKANKSDNGVVVSSDNYIDAYAKKVGKTYSEVFKEYVGKAITNMRNDAKHGFKNNDDVYWDQTNLTRRSREEKFHMVPSHYKKVAVLFEIPEENEHKRRLNTPERQGKIIPNNIMNNMKKNLEFPTENEGFDEIICIKNS